MKTDTIKILAVEDNPADLRLLMEYLRRTSSMDFEIQSAGNLHDALKLLSTGEFAVVLLDLNLPDSNGPETIEKVLALQPSVPVIVLTGMDDEEMGVLALSKNAQDYLVKGKIDTSSLVRSIRYSIERARAEEACAVSIPNWNNVSQNRLRRFAQPTNCWSSAWQNAPPSCMSPTRTCADRASLR